MKNRLFATGILWILAIALPWGLGNWGAFLLIGAFAVGSFLELLHLLKLAGRPVDEQVAVPAFVILLLALMLVPPWMIPPVALLAAGLSLTVIACLLRSTVGEFGNRVASVTGAVFLLLIPFATMALLVHESGLLIVIWVVAVAKFSDVGALLTGMAIGRHKMSPTFSPNKTWEGFAGGLLLSMIVSVVIVTLAGDHLPVALTPLHAAWMALPIATAGVLGDLMESVFKREAGVKDSGRSVPGIGGCLDLTDSMLLAFPVAYFLLWIIL